MANEVKKACIPRHKVETCDDNPSDLLQDRMREAQTELSHFSSREWFLIGLERYF